MHAEQSCANEEEQEWSLGWTTDCNWDVFQQHVCAFIGFIGFILRARVCLRLLFWSEIETGIGLGLSFPLGLGLELGVGLG